MSLDGIKFESLSPSDVAGHVADSLSDDMKEHLSRDENKVILEKLIGDAFSNRLFKDREAQVIINSIIKKFKDEALTGEIIKMLYLGGADKFESTQDHDRWQNALFLTIDADGNFIEHTDYYKNTGLIRTEKVWGRYPGFDETDEFAPGNVYNIEIVKQTKMYKGETRTFENLGGYSLVEGARDKTVDWILDNPTFNDELAEAIKDGDFTEGVITLLDKKAKWKNVVVDFFVEGVRAQKKSMRVREGGEFKMEFTDELLPINYVSDTQVANIVLSLTGSAKLPSGQELIFYLNFYPQRMGQYFVASPMLSQLMSNEDFISESPEHQADLLNLLMKGVQFRGLGQIRKFVSANDGKKLITTVGGISLVQVVD